MDNVDIQVDTPDGKGTVHATAMTIYQKTDVGDKSVDLEITGSARDRSIADLPETITDLLPVRILLPNLSILCMQHTA